MELETRREEKPKPRIFGFEAAGGHTYEVRWEPPTLVDGASMRGGPVGAQVWVYQTTVGRRRLIARAVWTGADLVLRPINERVFDRGVRSHVVAGLRTELQS